MILKIIDTIMNVSRLLFDIVMIIYCLLTITRKMYYYIIHNNTMSKKRVTSEGTVEYPIDLEPMKQKMSIGELRTVTAQRKLQQNKKSVDRLLEPEDIYICLNEASIRGERKIYKNNERFAEGTLNQLIKDGVLFANKMKWISKWCGLKKKKVPSGITKIYV